MMKKFRLEKAPNGATFIWHDLKPNLKIQVVQNDDFEYDKWNDVYDLFEFKKNTFALVVFWSEIDLDDVEDFSYIQSLLRKAWKWYRQQVYIEKYTPDLEEGDFETERYLLKPSAKDGWWVCVDKEAKIIIKWKEHLFNDTQEATELEELQLSVTEIARVLREMGDWLRENHYNKIF